MADPTSQMHLGFRVAFDALIPRGTIHINPLDWQPLHENTADVAALFQGTVAEALTNTDINATVVGPISGPSAGTGPLVPAKC